MLRRGMAAIGPRLCNTAWAMSDISRQRSNLSLWGVKHPSLTHSTRDFRGGRMMPDVKL
jgi:hypothetical protein